MQRLTLFLKRAARWAAMGMGAVLLAAGALLAQSDTAEVRPSDPQPRLGQSRDGAGFAERKEEVRASIELWEQRVRRKLEQIDQILQGLDLQQIQAQKIAVDTLIEILNDLDEEALAIIAAHDQVGPDLKLYREALLQAPDVFQRIAEDLEARATDKKSTFLKEAYADFAAEARKLAGAYEAKAAGIGGLESEVAKKMEFVHESREFILDVRGFLEAIPADHGLETERLIARINQYIEVFQDAINAIKGVADKIGEQPQPTTPDPARAEPAPLTRGKTTVSPISIEDYRQRLAALKG